jgi:hypothetical protein
VQDEDLVEGGVINEPDHFISSLKNSPLRADILSFPQDISDVNRRYRYYCERDNVAAASTVKFSDWWESLPQETRKNVRRAAKRGVCVRLAKFDDEFIRGIKNIYDETPTRQGKRFWHYGKSLEAVKTENGTYPERSEFIGAYHNDELIGVLKLVYVDCLARIMQIVAKVSHYDKRPMNALIAKAVEVCESRKIKYLIYSKFSFGNKRTSELAEFKRRNGFNQIEFIRYYIPLTVRGRIALLFKLHRGLLGILPEGAIKCLLSCRSWLWRFMVKLRGIRSTDAPTGLNLQRDDTTH